MTQNYNSVLSPNAHITVNRNRLKNYGDKIYLKNKTHFEIELFNPLTKRVKATIEIDGSPISSGGIVLRPGERVYLERWLDESKKFLFETYSIDDSDFEAKSATKNNGKVEIRFYKEADKTFINPNPWINPFWTYTTNTIGGSSDIASIKASFFSGQSVEGSGSMGEAMNTNSLRSKSFAKTTETGRAEKGELSNQQFSTTTGDFEHFTVSSSIWQILPESQKPVEMSQIRNYCSECGTRMRTSSWKYCPTCGTKIE